MYKEPRVVDSLCAFLEASLTGPFLEASANSISDFDAEEIREEAETGTTAKLLVPTWNLAPISILSGLEHSGNSPQEEAQGSTSRAEMGIGKLREEKRGDWDTEGWAGRGGGCMELHDKFRKFWIFTFFSTNQN